MKLFSIEELAILSEQVNTDCVSVYMPTYKMSTETLHTLLNGGKVYAVAPDKVPGDVQIAAVLRY